MLGIVLGSIANMAVVSLNLAFFPMPTGVDPNDPEALAAHVATLPAVAFLLPFLAHFSQVLVGGIAASKIGQTSPRILVGIVGALTVLGSVITNLPTDRSAGLDLDRAAPLPPGDLGHDPARGAEARSPSGASDAGRAELTTDEIGRSAQSMVGNPTPARRFRMAELILTTFDWVPEVPRGYVRDIRVRWALEEAGLPYRVETTPFQERDPEHFRHQPFGQVPWLTDGDLTVFESGAILLHLGERSEALLPTRPRQRSEALQWLFAALNSVESASMPWVVLVLSGLPRGTPEWEGVEGFLPGRLQHMEAVLEKREWLAGSFSIADILMADVLRVVDRFDGLANHPACRAYVARATARPAFVKAHTDQLAHFAAADAARAARASQAT